MSQTTSGKPVSFLDYEKWMEQYDAYHLGKLNDWQSQDLPSGLWKFEDTWRFPKAQGYTELISSPYQLDVINPNPELYTKSHTKGEAPSGYTGDPDIEKKLKPSDNSKLTSPKFQDWADLIQSFVQSEVKKGFGQGKD